MIGIICALPEELEAFVGAACDRKPSARDVVPFRLAGHDVVIAHCGLGKVGAAMTAAKLMERRQLRALVSAGTAGGLIDAGLHEVVVGLELIQHDYGRSTGAGALELYRPGDMPLPENRGKPIVISVPAERQRALRSLSRDLDYVRFGRYASGDTFVNDAATRDRLIALGAVAVDMESAAVAQVAEHYGVPWLVAKGITDDASATSHEGFLRELALASRRSAAVVGALLPALLGA